MKKKIIATFICVIFMCGSFAAGVKYSDYKSDGKSMENTAISLVRSFGWDIDDTEEISEIQETAFSFYQMYKHWTGGYDQELSGGNIEGIYPYFAAGDTSDMNMSKNVYYYIIPLSYKMPEGTKLQAIIAFHDGRICMSAIHADFSALIDKILEIEEEKKASGEDYEDITPVTWPLNVEQNIIGDWKVKFSEAFVQ